MVPPEERWELAVRALTDKQDERWQHALKLLADLEREMRAMRESGGLYERVGKLEVEAAVAKTKLGFLVAGAALGGSVAGSLLVKLFAS